MKKLIVSYLLSVVACQVMAQDDDMYFASDGSQKAQKVGNSVSSSNRIVMLMSIIADIVQNMIHIIIRIL